VDFAGRMGRRRANPVWSAAKGAREETRLLAEPRRLLAVFDKREDPHSPQLSYMYKAFTHCEIKAGELIQDTTETSVWTGYLSVPITNFIYSAHPPLARCNRSSPKASRGARESSTAILDAIPI